MTTTIRICCGLLLSLLFGACAEQNQQKTPDQSTTDPIVEATPEWLSLKGRPEMPTIVLVSGDEEYRSEEALPQMAKILTTQHGFNCTVLFAQEPTKPGVVNPNHLNNIPGLDQLAEADLMVLFTRFRALPDEQMQHIDNYLKAGKPVLGIRTATHAFNFQKTTFESSYKHYGNYYEGEDVWEGGFGRLVLGEKWIAHHGHHRHQSTRGIPAPTATNHPILNGIEADAIWGPTDVYGVRLPLRADAQPIVLGQVVNRVGAYDENDPLYGMRESDQEVASTNPAAKIAYDPNEPMMPIAWTKSYQIPNGQKGKVFTTTIGASTDLLNEGVRRMMTNAVYWCLDLEVPEKATVDLVGNYKPTAYAFRKVAYWEEKQMRIVNLE